MGKFRGSVLIFGMLTIIIAASLLTVLLLYATGGLVTAPVELTYKIENAEKAYDGTPLKAENYALVSGALKEGHTAVAEVTGEQLDAGTSTSGLAVKVYNEKNFEVTSEYAVKVEGGALKVTPAPLNVVLNDKEVVYNGGKVIFDDYTIISGNLVGGHKLGGLADAGLMDAGDKLPADLTPAVYDVWGRDVSANYSITFTRGEIEIVPRPVVLKPVGMTKVYDGAPLTCTQFEIIGGSFVEGHFAEVEFNDGEATITDVDTFRAVITDVCVYSADGKDVTANYDIDYSQTDLLIIQPRPLTVTAKSGTWVFDGKVHTFEDDITPLAVSGLAANDEIYSVACSGSVQNVGTAVNEITGINLSSEKRNYDITYINGTLEVTPFNLTVYCKTLNKEYDGEPLAADGNIFDLSPALPEEFAFGFNGGGVEQKVDVGAGSFIISDISITYEGGECKDNFEILIISGSYNITKKTVNIPLAAFSVEYNGEEFTPAIQDALKDADLPESLPAASFGLLPYTQMKDAGSYVYDVKLLDTDSAKNYDLQISLGKVEITKKRVTLIYSGGNIQKTYDGKPAEADIKSLNIDGYSVRSAELDKRIVNVSDSGTASIIRVSAYDNYNADVTKNLDIDYSGARFEITVTPRPVTVIILDITYNGADFPSSLSEDILSGKSFISTETPLAEGDMAYIELGYGKSSHKIEVDEFIIVGSDGVTDVSANYLWTNEDVFTYLTLVSNS